MFQLICFTLHLMSCKGACCDANVETIYRTELIPVVALWSTVVLHTQHTCCGSCVFILSIHIFFYSVCSSVKIVDCLMFGVISFAQFISIIVVFICGSLLFDIAMMSFPNGNHESFRNIMISKNSTQLPFLISPNLLGVRSRPPAPPQWALCRCEPSVCAWPAWRSACTFCHSGCSCTACRAYGQHGACKGWSTLWSASHTQARYIHRVSLLEGQGQ